MVLLLNLIIPVVVLGSCWVSYKKKKAWPLLFIPFFMFFYMKVQPSYMPKGDIARSYVPELSSSGKAEIEDRNRKAVPSEIRNAQQQQAYKDGLPFIPK